MSTKTARITEEDLEKLNEIAKSLKMTQPVLIGYLIGQAQKYEMFAPDWMDKLVEDRFHELLLEADIGYRRGFQQDKHRAILATKQMMIKELLKTMDVDQRREYLIRTLGDPSKDVDLLETMTSSVMFNVDGEKKLMPQGQDGRPRIVGIAPSQIKECPVGWHTENNPCVGCNRNKTCEIRFDERVNWLALHGTKKQRDDFFAKSQVRRLN